MVLLNGIEFYIYDDVDNASFIKDRIAKELNTLPNYLYFEPTRGASESKGDDSKDIDNIDIDKQLNLLTNDTLINITVINIIEFIRENSKKKKDFIDLFKQIMMMKPDMNVDEIISYYLLYYKTSIPDGIILSIQNDLNNLGIKKSLEDINKIYRERNTTMTNYEGQIENFNKTVEEKVILFNTYEKSSETEHTEFFLEKNEIDLILNYDKVGIYEVFNDIVLYDYVPFARVGRLNKVLKDYEIPKVWLEDNKDGEIDENMIVLYVYKRKKNLSEKEDKYFTKLMIIIDKDNKVKVNFQIDINAKNANIDEFIDRFLRVFKDKKERVVVEKIVDVSVNGVVYFPSFKLNKYILSDLIMNDKLFTYFLVVNEFEHATKKKAGLYLQFDTELVGTVRANIVDKLFTKYEENMTSEFPQEPYIKLKINRSKNKEIVSKFIKIMSKLLTVYKNKKKKVIKFYREYIPKFDKEKVSIVTEEKEENKYMKLKRLVPELFVSKASRFGAPNSLPTIVDDERAKEEEKKGLQVMRFPNTGSDIPIRNYICEDEQFKFPGVVINPLTNKERFPYLPRCFKKDQREKKTYKLYFKGEKEKEKKFKQQNVIVTNKCVPFKGFGEIPDYMRKLFKLFDNKPNEKYLKVGVKLGSKDEVDEVDKLSFLTCVLFALDIDGIRTLEEKEEFKAIVYSNYDEFTESKNVEENVAVCKQELYDYTSSDIIKYLKEKNYFDPKLFISLLEHKYNCNIYIFSKTEMIIPKHSQMYLKYNNNKPSVFIYENQGSESDNLSYPCCEVIMKYSDDPKNVKNTFVFDDKLEISKGIKDLFNQLNKSYINNKLIPMINFPLKSSVVSQSIDIYGKTRIINVKFEENDIFIFTIPIPPLYVVETENDEVIKTDINVVKNFLKFNQVLLKNISKTTSNGSIKYVNAKIGDVYMFIPVKNTNGFLESLPEVKNSFDYPSHKKSYLKKYNKNKKLSRYIIEYVFWFYSKYLHENGYTINDINKKSIDEFISKKIEVFSGEYDESKITNIFSMDDSTLVRDEKLLVPKDSISKLQYVLVLKSIRNVDELFNYNKRTHITSYYQDITDFKISSNQVIVFNDGDTLITKGKTHNIVFDSVLQDVDTYFFKNELINDTIYLAQNTDSLDKAINIAVVWKEEGYNIGKDAIDSIKYDYKFTLYSYKNRESIEAFYIVGNDNNYKIKIIGYKNEEDKCLFTVLLDIKSNKSNRSLLY